MTVSAKAPLRCAILGMDARTGYSYQYCIRQYPDGAYVLANSEEDAQLLLIDIDSPEGRRIAQRYLSGDAIGKAVVIFSASQTAAGEHLFFLRKPASPEALRNVLDRAAASVAGSPSATPLVAAGRRGVAGAALAMEEEEDAHFNRYLFGSDDASHKDVFFNPDQYLYGAVCQARRMSEDNGRVVELRCGETAPLRICARTRRVHTALRDQVLRSIVISTSLRHSLALLDEENEKSWPATGRTECLDAFLWRLAVWTSRGRLPQGSDPNARMRLRHWPNMTRLIPTPHGMQIAALWTAAPRTMATIAGELMISPSDVYVFYSAAASIGLMEIEVRAPGKAVADKEEARISRETAVSAVPAAPEPVQQKNRGLLGRILARLMSVH